jgi:hypothetical protein
MAYFHRLSKENDQGDSFYTLQTKTRRLYNFNISGTLVIKTVVSQTTGLEGQVKRIYFTATIINCVHINIKSFSLLQRLQMYFGITVGSETEMKTESYRFLAAVYGNQHLKQIEIPKSCVQKY